MKKLIIFMVLSFVIVFLAALTNFTVLGNLLRAGGMSSAVVRDPGWWQEIEENLGSITISIVVMLLVLIQFAIAKTRGRKWYFKTLGFFLLYLFISGFLLMLPSLYLTIYQQLRNAMTQVNWIATLYIAVLVASMLIGILAKHMWDYTENRKLRGVKGVWRAFYSFETFRPFIISPIVMISVLEISKRPA